MKHPSEGSLALFAGGELGLLARLRVRRHLSWCHVCREELDSLESSRAWLKEASSELPQGFNWNRMAGEMRANIHVGLAAGECVASPGWHPLAFGLRAALTAAPVALVLLLGWWLQPARPKLEPQGVVLEATSKGIELRDGAAVLSLQHPGEVKDSDVTYTVSVQGTLRARYVDSQTGQVTIHNVYTQ